jgi:hypothetical protein
MGVLAGTLRTAAGRVLALGGAAIGCAAVAVPLAARVAGLAASASAVRADGLVELAVLAAGVLVLVWLAGSAGLAAVCVAARGLGRRWGRGEKCVRRIAPAVIRRAMVVVVVAGLGAASVTSASAADLPPTGTPTAATVVSDDDGTDLGWVATAPGHSPSAPATTPTSGSARPIVTVGPTRPGPTPSTTGPTSAAPEPSPAPSGPQPSALETPAGERGMATPPPLSPAGTIVGPDALSIPRAPRWTPVTPVADDETDAAVVVVRGDTLWDIAARHLPAGASDAQVAAAWPAWYAANAATIGPDPSVIRPGQILAVPAGVTR